MTALTRWSPFSRSVAWPFDIWNDFAGTRRSANVPLRLGLDVINRADGYTVEASLPGFDADEIDVTVDEGVLRIAASKSSDATEDNGSYVVRERRTGKFYRAIRIPDGVDIDAAATSYKDGVLRIDLPKVDSGKPKRLPIAA